MQTQGQLFIIAAASGTGKTSLVRALLERIPDLQVSVSYTTRKPRSSERNGINYHFITIEKFKTMVADHAFLEHAQVFDDFYGTGKDWVNEKLQQGIDVILEIDWQGAETVMATADTTCSIFIIPPNLQTLKQRLVNRAQDSEDTINKRISKAQEEIAHYRTFDYLIMNDDFDQALSDLCHIVQATRLSQARQSLKLQKILENLLP